MACISNCRYTNFGPYYPCDVTTCGCNCAGNTVVNPTISEDFIFLTLVTPTEIDSGDLIPLTLSLSGGSGITLTDPGVVSLAPGTYQATYNVSSEIGADGVNSFAFELNGSVIASSATEVQGSVGNNVSQTSSVVFTITENGELRLINNGSETVTVNIANLTIRRIS